MGSTAIRRFAYDQEAEVLDVMFVTGRRYRYFAVPARVAQAFDAAESKGGFFNAAIRDRYTFEEISSSR